MMKRRIFFVVAICSIAGCSPGKDTAAADKSIANFHAYLNAGRFAEIYNSSAPVMKVAAKQENFIKLLDAVHRKLGTYKKGKTVGWNDNVTTGGHFVTLNRSSDYDRGKAEEQFVFKTDGDQASLVGYHVNSDALILN